MLKTRRNGPLKKRGLKRVKNKLKKRSKKEVFFVLFLITLQYLLYFIYNHIFFYTFQPFYLTTPLYTVNFNEQPHLINEHNKAAHFTKFNTLKRAVHLHVNTHKTHIYATHMYTYTYTLFVHIYLHVCKHKKTYLFILTIYYTRTIHFLQNIY